MNSRVVFSICLILLLANVGCGYREIFHLTAATQNARTAEKPSSARENVVSTGQSSGTSTSDDESPALADPEIPAEIIVGIRDPSLIMPSSILDLQPVGVPFLDPAYGTILRRVSNSMEQGGFETQIYSQLQAFSADNQYLLLDSPRGFLVRRVDDLSFVAGLDTSTWNDPRWHPLQSNIVVHFDSNEDSRVKLQFTDVKALTTTTIFTFPDQYEYILVNPSFDELSDDGRWLTGMLTRDDGQPVIFALDIENRALTTQLALSDLYRDSCEPDPIWGEVEPDWIAASPLGRYLVVQWVRDWEPDTPTPRCSGLETYDLHTGEFIGRVSPHHNHGDLGVDTDGVSEFFMTTELESPMDGNRPAIAMRALPGESTVSPPRYLQVVDWADVDHISCQGPLGVCLVSWGSLGENIDFAFENEIFLQYTDGSVLRLAHHRSSKCGYWVQPRASISRDGRYVIFASDWGEANSCVGGDDLGRGDPYIIDLRARP